jgi:hypothetical protein
MALMFDVRPTCIYRYPCKRCTRQLAIADLGNVIKAIMCKKKVLISEVSLYIEKLATSTSLFIRLMLIKYFDNSIMQ